MLDRLLEFADALRAAGVPVGTSESLDALRALHHVSFAERNVVQATLAATMLKSAAHRPAFDTLFHLYFGSGRGPESLAERDAADPPMDATAFEAELSQALAGAGGASLDELARRAVAAFGRIENPSAGLWYSHYEVMRALDLTALVARIGEVIEAGTDDEMARRLRKDEFVRRAARFRAATLAQTRRRAAEHKGPATVAAYAVQPLPEDLNFLSATADMAELRRAIRPLARKLATRVAMKRRRSRRGHVDIRRTVRHSLSTGGVPFETAHRRRIPHRPELFILCDVSSSVSRFSRFSLMLTHALKTQFTRVRAFAFIDKVDEVTRFFDHEDFAAAVAHMDRDADVVWVDGRSDYGSCLETFLGAYADDIGPRTTVLILGDARNNYRARKSWALAEIKTKARRTYWLNPEPRRDWDTGDSAASDYAGCVDKMVEVRNLRQLERFIAEIL